MYELRFDAENSDENWEYYDIYLNNIPIYKDPVITVYNDTAILSLSVDKRDKSIEMINVSEHVLSQIRSSRYKLYDLIISFIDELDIRDYCIYVLDPPEGYNDIMTNELAYEIEKVYPDYNIQFII